MRILEIDDCKKTVMETLKSIDVKLEIDLLDLLILITNFGGNSADENKRITLETLESWKEFEHLNTDNLFKDLDSMTSSQFVKMVDYPVMKSEITNLLKQIL